MTAKLTLEYIKEKTKEWAEGYECLAKEYINAHTKYENKCKEGHIYKTSWNNFQGGRRCPKCSIKNRANNIRLDYFYIKKYIEKFEKKLHSEEYLGAHYKLKIECKKSEHIYYMTWNNFRKGQRCSVCAIENNKGKNHYYWRGGKGVAWYDTYALYLNWCENIRPDPDNKKLLQVKCIKCNNWFNPTSIEVISRIKSLKGNSRGESRFYCSDECKQECDIYGRSKYPKGFNLQTDYRNLVVLLTEKNYKKYKDIINPIDLKRGNYKYHIDHIYSVIEGFENNIPAEIIASPINQRMLKWNKNISKGSNSEFTKKELFNLYKQFNQEMELIK